MSSKVIEQPLENILRGDGDDFARDLLRAWIDCEGYLTSDFVVDVDRLVLLDALQPGQPSPDILFCGENALAASAIGGNWHQMPTKAETFKRDFRKLIGRHYEKAMKTDRPVFDFVSAPTSVNERAFNFKYERLILPLRTLVGAQFLYCYSFAPSLKVSKLDPVPAGEFQLHQHPQNTRLLNRPAWAECATQFRADIPSSSPSVPHSL